MPTVQPMPTSTPQESQALDFTMSRFIAVVTELNAARGKLAAVEALVTQARKVSPSPTMAIYCVDIERVLGLSDQASPHKLGMNDGDSS